MNEFDFPTFLNLIRILEYSIFLHTYAKHIPIHTVVKFCRQRKNLNTYILVPRKLNKENDYFLTRKLVTEKETRH